MVVASFQEELCKIARSKRPGELDLSGIHRDNLRSQREDLKDAERKGAYLKAGISGLTLGSVAPTLMYAVPAASDQRAMEAGVRREYLSNALEKALKANPDLMKGQDAKKIRQTAEQTARHYYSTPEALRHGGPDELLKGVRAQYRDPATGPRWTMPASMKGSVHEMLGKVHLDSDGRVILSQQDVQEFLHKRNQKLVKKTVAMSTADIEAHLKPGGKVVNPTPKIQHLGIPKATGNSPDALAQSAMREMEENVRRMARRSSSTEGLNIQGSQAQVGRHVKRNVIGQEHLDLKPFKYPSTPSSQVPGRRQAQPAARGRGRRAWCARCRLHHGCESAPDTVDL